MTITVNHSLVLPSRIKTAVPTREPGVLYQVAQDLLRLAVRSYILY